MLAITSLSATFCPCCVRRTPIHLPVCPHCGTDRRTLDVPLLESDGEPPGPAMKLVAGGSLLGKAWWLLWSVLTGQ